jgi:phosphoribosyl-ATP pyrophosphohydrolase
MNPSPTDTLLALQNVLQERKSAPAEKSYAASLYAKGLDTILKKVGEESAETIIAAKNQDSAALVYEVADLWYHVMVLLASKDIPVTAVTDELARRMGTSGHAEKASRAK